jgi:hypothetical protein
MSEPPNFTIPYSVLYWCVQTRTKATDFTIPYSLFPIPYQYSVFSIQYSLFSIPYSPSLPQSHRLPLDPLLIRLPLKDPVNINASNMDRIGVKLPRLNKVLDLRNRDGSGLCH